MRQRDWRTVGGLVVIGLAVWIAAWLLQAIEGDAVQAPGSGGGVASGSVPAAIEQQAALPEAQSAALPSSLVDAAASDALAVEEPGEALHLIGRVVDTARTPVAGAVLYHWPTGSQREALGLPRRGYVGNVPWERLATARTGADGRFFLDVRDDSLGRQVLSGSRRDYIDVFGTRPGLVVEHPEHATATAYVMAARAGDVDVGDIVLGAGATLVGRLVDPDGAPVSGAWIGVTPGGMLLEAYRQQLQLQAGRLTAVTDAAGRFRMTGAWPGTFRLLAEARGFELLEQELEVAQPGVRDLGDVCVARSKPIAGLVKTAQGQPVRDARVRVRPPFAGADGADAAATTWDLEWDSDGRSYAPDALEVRTDALGAFRMDGLFSRMSAFDVLASADGLDPDIARRVAAGRDDIVLTLSPQATWALRLVGTDGAHVDGGNVSGVRYGADRDAFSCPLQAEAVDGAFMLRGASRAHTDVMASAPGYATQVESLPGLQAGETREHTLQLLRESTLAVRVTDDAGTPLAGAGLRLSPPAAFAAAIDPRVVRADADGRFRFTALAAGEWLLRASAPDVLPMLHDRPVPLAPEQQLDLVLVLPRAGRITGLVRLAGGEPIPSAWVRGESLSSQALDACAAAGQVDVPPDDPTLRNLELHGFSGPDGRFTLTGVAPGAWKVDGGEGAETTVQLIAQESVDVELVRPQPPRVVGRVTRSGQPVAGALVDLGYGPEIGNADWIQMAATRSDADGRYVLECASDEHYYLRATADGVSSYARKVQLVWSQTQEIDIALPVARLAGRVVDSTGAGVGNVTIAFGDPVAIARRTDPFGLTTTSAPDGSFAFDPVGPGPWMLSADAGDGSYSYVARQAVDVAADRPVTEVTVQLQDGASVEVVVNSTEKLALTLVPADGIGFDAHSRRMSDGIYRFTRLAPGEWRLSVKRRKGREWVEVHSEPVQVASGQELRLQVSLGS